MQGLGLSNLKLSLNLSRDHDPRIMYSIPRIAVYLKCIHWKAPVNSLWNVNTYIFGALACLSLGMWRAVDSTKNILFYFLSNWLLILVLPSKEMRDFSEKGKWEEGNVLLCIVCCFLHFSIFSSFLLLFSHLLPTFTLVHLPKKDVDILLVYYYLSAWFARLLQYAPMHLGKIGFSLKWKYLYRVSHSETFTINIITELC